MQVINYFKKKSVVLFFIISSVIGILFLSSCSNVFPWYIPDDSDIFLTIGKYWSTGECVPYLNLFDHKGPIIFFISAIGYFITGSKFGVAIIEMVTLFISELLAYKILRFSFSKCWSIILSALMPVLFLYNFVPGNYTEEYMLPFLFGSFCLFIKWQKTDRMFHKPKYAFFYGISFGFALMTRISNSLSICLIVVIILFNIVKNKQWKNLLYNALGFVFGVCIIVVPFCIYFYTKDALYDMWYATLLYNFDYTSNSSLEFEHTLKDIVLIIRMTFFGSVAVVICLYRLVCYREIKDLEWAFIIIPSTVFIFMLDRFPNYSLLLLPFLYISFIGISNTKICNRYKSEMIIIVLIALLLSSIVKINKLNTFFGKESIVDSIGYKELLRKIPEKELENNFIFIDPSVDFYLIEDIKPCSKYFIFQSWQSKNSNEFKNKFLCEFKNNKDIHYVVFHGKPGIISEIINSCFIKIDEENDFYLFRRIEY